MENTKCPCCGRHCDLSEPHCERGKEYLRTGVIPERRHEDHKHEGHMHEDHMHEGHEPKTVRCTEQYRNMEQDVKLIINLRDLGHRIRFLFEGKGSQKRILILLLESGGMTQRALTERIGVQPGSASEVIGKLEHAGLIARTPSAEDRRTADIRLTDAGTVLAREAAEQRRIRHQEMFACLSQEEKDTLLKLSEKLNADWDARYRDAEKAHDHEHGGHCGGHERHGGRGRHDGPHSV
ncbi:MAG: MarR family winged helix-turn-helix transcriptional regulator [Hominenteromicrobium sp.]